MYSVMRLIDVDPHIAHRIIRSRRNLHFRLFRIDISDAEFISLKRRPRTYVSGIVREGAHVFTNVGIHLKGMGSFRSVDEKPSLVLKFDEFVPEQEYSGLTKLMLNNSVQDQPYLAELLATGLFRDAGVPAARVTHTRVTLNGRDLGLYVAIDAMNKRFLKRHFHNNDGNLYEGYLRDINTRLDQDNGIDTSQGDVRNLLAQGYVPVMGQDGRTIFLVQSARSVRGGVSFTF